jgi:N-acylneuraminate cytidylyltransferase
MSSPQPAWTAVIPLRAGSKGLPGKNTRMLAGKPLYRHAVDQALEAGAARVLITTDIAELKTVALPVGVEVIERPLQLATDAVPMAPVLSHALIVAGCTGTAVLLQATSPLRRASDIRAALAIFQRGAHELVMSVTPADRGVLKWGLLDGDRFCPLSDPSHCFANRQSLPPVVRPNGAIYVLDAAWFVARGSFVSDRIGVVEMDGEHSLDIDTPIDFERCEAALGAQSCSDFQESAP